MVEVKDTSFGSITVEEKSYSHDIIITTSGEVKKRRKELSKKLYGTSHRLSLEEAKFIYEKNTKFLIIGAGQYNKLNLSSKALKFFNDEGVEIIKKATPKAVQEYNLTAGEKIGLFHVTC